MITIPRTGKRPLVFYGALVADLVGGNIRVRVYRSDRGAIVVHVTRYLSDDRDYHEAEVFGSAVDAVAWLEAELPWAAEEVAGLLGVYEEV